MSTELLLQRLSTHRTVGSLPPGEIAWVAAHGVLRSLDSGRILTAKDGPVDGLHIVLAGHLAIHVDRGAGKRKIMEWRGGDVTGLMPYSRLVAPPGNVVAEEATELVTVYRKDMPEMIGRCQEFTAILVHIMVDRARHFTSSYLHDEKLVSLGKLAAGLAHELNNPAAAIVRSGAAIASTASSAEAASRALGALRLTAENLAAVQNVRDKCLAGAASTVLSALERADREDAISDWLERHGLDGSAADTLAETNITFDMMEQLAASMDHEALAASFRWIASDCATQSLTREVQEAASRISDLVTAIKGFTEMDRSSVPEPVDIRQGLANTVTVLRAKARGKSVGMTMDVEKALPLVNGFGGELNQVWANLIDNALDAVDEGGQIHLQANRERDAVVVRVIDNGPGISAEIRDRIFDPFFTTKPVGKGTGLGLDIVRRLLQRHNAQIELDSIPGRTEFRVTFPIETAAEGTGG